MAKVKISKIHQNLKKNLIFTKKVSSDNVSLESLPESLGSVSQTILEE